MHNRKAFSKRRDCILWGKCFSGYADCLEDLKLQDTNQGRLQTGDIGYKDEDGYFYITGRKNRFVKICGKRMSLDEIEQKTKSKFRGVDCAITGNDTCLQVYIDQERVEEVTRIFAKEVPAWQITGTGRCIATDSEKCSR